MKINRSKERVRNLLFTLSIFVFNIFHFHLGELVWKSNIFKLTINTFIYGLFYLPLGTSNFNHSFSILNNVLKTHDYWIIQLNDQLCQNLNFRKFILIGGGRGAVKKIKNFTIATCGILKSMYVFKVMKYEFGIIFQFL